MAFLLLQESSLVPIACPDWKIGEPYSSRQQREKTNIFISGRLSYP